MANVPGASPGTFGRTSLKMAVVSGGAAGNITVTGIKTTDLLIGVTLLGTSSTAHADLSAEFSITAADTINNTGGTNTSNCKLQVLYHAAQPES